MLLCSTRRGDVENGGLTLRWRAQVFEAIDAWVEASRGWTVGGLQKRLLIHSVHGCSRPAAVLCAWMMSRGAGKVALADALRAVQGMQPSAAPNFGFIAQLLEHGACTSLLCSKSRFH
jgi:predicted protein tyrosine phosphatase